MTATARSTAQNACSASITVRSMSTQVFVETVQTRRTFPSSLPNQDDGHADRSLWRFAGPDAQSNAIRINWGGFAFAINALVNKPTAPRTYSFIELSSIARPYLATVRHRGALVLLRALVCRECKVLMITVPENFFTVSQHDWNASDVLPALLYVSPSDHRSCLKQDSVTVI